jgi:hypothetical protein
MREQTRLAIDLSGARCVESTLVNLQSCCSMGETLINFAGTHMASRVLLVDPDPVSRKLRSRLLNESGYAVFPARDSEDAISRVKPGAYDAVLIAEDERRALAFCEQVRRADPEQVVIVIAEPWAYIPQQPCPNEVLRGGSPKDILRTVNAVLHGSAANRVRPL